MLKEFKNTQRITRNKENDTETKWECEQEDRFFFFLQKKNQLEILELKNIITELKNSLEWS